jgi:hypothetical protein
MILQCTFECWFADKSDLINWVQSRIKQLNKLVFGRICKFFFQLLIITILVYLFFSPCCLVFVPYACIIVVKAFFWINKLKLKLLSCFLSRLHFSMSHILFSSFRLSYFFTTIQNWLHFYTSFAFATAYCFYFLWTKLIYYFLWTKLI